jgi:quinol monooxygenase YgiN
MINVIVSFDVRPGRGEALCDWLAGALEKTRANPGCQGAQLNRDLDDPDAPVLIEQWESADTHKAFVEQLVSSGAMNAAMSFLNGPPRSHYYEV